VICELKKFVSGCFSFLKNQGICDGIIFLQISQLKIAKIRYKRNHCYCDIYDLSIELNIFYRRHFEMVPTQVWMGKYGWIGLLLPQALTSLPLSLLQGTDVRACRRRRLSRVYSSHSHLSRYHSKNAYFVHEVNIIINIDRSHVVTFLSCHCFFAFIVSLVCKC